jgi:hypothetical protein
MTISTSLRGNALPSLTSLASTCDCRVPSTEQQDIIPCPQLAAPYSHCCTCVWHLKYDRFGDGAFYITFHFDVWLGLALLHRQFTAGEKLARFAFNLALVLHLGGVENQLVLATTQILDLDSENN